MGGQYRPPEIASVRGTILFCTNMGTAAAMKNYKCVFDHGNGRTTIWVSAANAEQALQNARDTVSDRSATVEVWDETGLVLKKGAGPPLSELTQRAS